MKQTKVDTQEHDMNSLRGTRVLSLSKFDTRYINPIMSLENELCFKKQKMNN